MPGSETAPPFRIADGLEQIRLWELVEAEVIVALECAACGRRARWTPVFMTTKLRKWSGKRLMNVALKTRCGACRSPHVRLWREREPPPQ